MAVAFVKAHTGFTTKTSGTDFTVTLTSAVPSGNTLIVGIGYDNSGTSAPTANAASGWTKVRNSFTSVTSAAGGVNCALYARTSDGSASFNSGATFTFQIAASVVARAAVIGEFSGCDTVTDVTNNDQSTSISSSGSGVGGNVAGNALVGIVASEANTDVSVTGGTLGAVSTTTGGGSAANASVGLGYLVMDGSGIDLLSFSTPSDGSGAFAVVVQAASGPQTYQVTGTIASTSGQVGTPTSYQGVTATAAATSGQVGTPTSRQNVTGTSAATSGTVGSVAKVIPGASGTVAAVSGTAGDITIAPTSTTYQVTGTAASSTTSSGSVASRLALTATSASTTTTAGSVALVKPGMSGTVAAVSGLAGNVTAVTGPVTYPVTGTLAASSALSGATTALLELIGTVPAVTSAAGAVDVITAPPSAGGFWGIRL